MPDIFQRRTYIDGPFGQIHVRIAGDTGLPLLLLHQSPLSGAMFAAALEHLAAAGVQAVAMDTPGYGASDPPPAPIGIADYGDSIAAVLDGMGWERPAILGHHTGASLAAAFSARRPQRVGALILNGVALLSREEREFFDGFSFSPLQIKKDGSHLLAAWKQRLAASPGWCDLAAMHRYVVEMLGNPERYHWGFDAAFAHDLRSDLLAIRNTTMILTNTGEDLYQASRRAHDLRPDFDFTELLGGTHDIVDEQPKAWAQAVSQWLQSHCEQIAGSGFTPGSDH
jgi:pimeloyl-ACP methyl ester carboxylesterase